MYDFDVIIKLLFAMSIKKYYNLDNLLYLSSAFGFTHHNLYIRIHCNLSNFWSDLIRSDYFRIRLGQITSLN